MNRKALVILWKRLTWNFLMPGSQTSITLPQWSGCYTGLVFRPCQLHLSACQSSTSLLHNPSLALPLCGQHFSSSSYAGLSSLNLSILWTILNTAARLLAVSRSLLKYLPSLGSFVCVGCSSWNHLPLELWLDSLELLILPLPLFHPKAILFFSDNTDLDEL